MKHAKIFGMIVAWCLVQQVVPWAESACAGAGLKQTLELQGLRFEISCPNTSSINTLTIKTSGLKQHNVVINREADGTVIKAEAGDLDANGFPEIYVYVQSAGSGSYGSLVAYASNKNLSLSEIYLPPVADNPLLSKGYMGHDEFQLVENTFAQRFPLYDEKSTNSNPSGKLRQLHYRLQPGEAGWILKFESMMEFDAPK
jgi:hypothetical protein